MKIRKIQILEKSANMIIGIGEQSFEAIRENNLFYIDKTDFIRQWWEAKDSVTLITRPRRFGKTLNMNMLECFFSNKYKNRGDLFEGLSIWQREEYRQLQGTYPVIFLSFASIKTGDIDEIRAKIKQIISNVYDNFRYIMQSDVFNDKDREYYAAITDKMDNKTVDITINRLCMYLEKYYEKKVIILLDEYDTPMQEAWISGRWDEAVAFFRSFFNATFKTNPHITNSIITGITRISKESIFSDLNHLEVVTTTSEKYATCFGFTEEEVFASLEIENLGNEKEGVKSWYDGFVFGRCFNIYNPWSITKFLSSHGNYDTYWADTSENSLINSLIQKGSADVKQIFEELMKGQCFEAELEEQISFNQLNQKQNAIWSLLLATGYLRIEKMIRIGRLKKKKYTLKLTNMEVESMFADMISGWFDEAAVVYNEFIKALLNDDIKKMNTFMNKVALTTFSSFDTGNHPSGQAEPERFYHGFVISMVIDLADRYRVISNRESGYGRYDVLIEPFDKSQKAFIFEFKVLDLDAEEKVLEDTVKSALAQIEEKQYESTLLADGIELKNIRKYGFAFKGKNCLIGTKK